MFLVFPTWFLFQCEEDVHFSWDPTETNFLGLKVLATPSTSPKATPFWDPLPIYKI